MTFKEFMAGKYGISHGIISIFLIAIGTGIGFLVGNLIFGNLFAAGMAFGAYSMRESVQGRSYNPEEWSPDGKLDALIPTIVVVINLIGLYHLSSIKVI